MIHTSTDSEASRTASPQAGGVAPRSTAPPGHRTGRASLRRRARGEPELMDAPDCDPGLLAGALDALAAADRLFGGQRALRTRITKILAGAEAGPLRVLDVGAGGGDVAVALGRHLRASGYEPRFVLGDVHAGVLRLCRARVGATGSTAGAGTVYVRLDGAALPFADDSFDFALSSATLHHLEDVPAARLLSELDRVSRLGWVITDLRRTRIAWLSVRLLAATLWRADPFPRTDGPISVRRSFTVPEVRRLLDDAGLQAAVRPHVVRWVAWRASDRAGTP